MPRGTGKRSTQRKSDNLRASIIAAILAGQAPAEIEKRFNVSRPTISRIKARIGTQDLKNLEKNKAEKLESLVIGCLESSFRAQSAIADHASDKQWLARNAGGDVAVLLKELSAQSCRILEAIQAGGNEETPAGAANSGAATPPLAG